MGLGSILGAVGSLVAAPFTGGTSLAWLPAALGAGGALADTLGGAAKAGQSANQSNDALKIALANAQTARNKQALDAPGERMGTALKSVIASHYTPRTVQWGGPGSGLKGQVPTFSGGVQGALAGAKNDPQMKQLMDRIMQDELSSQMTGGPTGGNKDLEMPQVGQSSTGDKIVGGLGLGSSILGALGKSGILDKILGKGAGGSSAGMGDFLGGGDYA